MKYRDIFKRWSFWILVSIMFLIDILPIDESLFPIEYVWKIMGCIFIGFVIFAIIIGIQNENLKKDKPDINKELKASHNDSEDNLKGEKTQDE